MAPGPRGCSRVPRPIVAAVRRPTTNRPAARGALPIAETPATGTQSRRRNRTLKSVPPWRNWAQSPALGKPRSATSVQRPPAGKAGGSGWTSVSVVARKRPLGQGYGMTAQPMGSVRPATTMPANQTSQGPSRVVSSATTG
jgi:hypothetical protein